MTLLVGRTLTPEVPFDIRTWLRAQDARLSLEWNEIVGQWALVVEWTADDPRRAETHGRLIDGEIRVRKTHDIACFIPKDAPLAWVQSVAPKYAARLGVGMSVRELARQVEEHNEQQSDENFKPLLEETMNRVEVLVGNRAVMTVYMNGKTTITRASDTAERDKEYLREKQWQAMQQHDPEPDE